MAKSITRCPKCKTAFRVTDAHLNTPKGAVRCGSCLNIFVARNYLIEPSPEDNESKAQPSAIKPQKKTDASKKADQQKEPPKPSHYDDELISDDMPLEDNEDDTKSIVFDENIMVGSKAATSVENNLFEVSRTATEDEVLGDTDESWALDLLDDDEDDEDDASDEEIYDDTFEESPKTDTGSFEKVKTGQFSTFELLSEEDDEFNTDLDLPDTSDTGQREAIPDKAKERGSRTKKTPPEDDSEHHEEIIGEDAYYNNALYETGTQNAYVDSIEPEAVEFSWKNRGSSIWNSNKLWLALSVLAFVVAVGQTAYFQFDKYNRIEPFRDYYKIACGIIGCTLPGLVDLSQIRAANLVVRSHPEETDSLLVDAILQNKAGYEQAFPALDLVFTDIDNNPVAAKRFLPEEYLAGELAGRSVMPSNQPIHIALKIEDPGDSAVSYQMSISQAKN